MVSVPELHHWLAGEDMSATRMNEIKAQIDFLRNPPMVHVARNAAQTLSSGWNAISFDTVLNGYDPYDMWDISDPSAVYSRVPGWYSVEGQFSLNGTATDERLILGVYKNSFATSEIQMRSDVQNFPSFGNANLSKEFTVFLNEGDFLYLGVWFDVDATRTTGTTTPSEICRFRLRWVSS